MSKIQLSEHALYQIKAARFVFWHSISQVYSKKARRFWIFWIIEKRLGFDWTTNRCIFIFVEHWWRRVTKFTNLFQNREKVAPRKEA